MTLKADKSPVTVADIASHRLLTHGLAAMEPRHPILSEEGALIPYDEGRAGSDCGSSILSMGRKNSLTAMASLRSTWHSSSAVAPVLGVVHAPTLGKTYWAARGVGAFLRDERDDTTHAIRAADYREASTLKVVVSRSHAGL